MDYALGGLRHAGHSLPTSQPQHTSDFRQTLPLPTMLITATHVCALHYWCCMKWRAFLIKNLLKQNNYVTIWKDVSHIRHPFLSLDRAGAWQVVMW